MVCIYCGHDTKVTNSRPQKRLNRIWRRRKCIACNSTFTSVESADLTSSISVHTDKQLKPFIRDILLLSVYDSLKHRKTALHDATWLTDTVISKLIANISDAKVTKREISSVTTDTLQRFDKLSAAHYSAFHQSK